MSYLDKILEWFNIEPITDQYSFWLGITIMGGLVIAIIVLATIFRIVRIIRRPAKGISIKSGKGEMHVSMGALKDFVHSSLKDISYIKVSKISLSGSSSSLSLLLAITAPQDKNLPSLTDEIREKVNSGLKNKLGINSVKRVKIRLKSFNSKSSEEPLLYSSTAISATEDAELADEQFLEENPTIPEAITTEK